MQSERVVTFRPRTILSTAGILLGLACALWIVWAAREVLTWVLISVFLALALNPAVAWVERRGVSHRGAAAAMVYLAALLVIVGLGFLVVPVIVDQVTGFVDALPGYVHDLTAGRGPLGFLQTKYHIVDRVQEATVGGGGALAGGASTALSITKSVLTTIAAIITILFMTFFMLLEGPAWADRLYSLVPVESRPRWENVGERIARTISGYVTGNLLISLMAGVSAGLVLLVCGVPYPVALGLLVAVLDLVPLAGATIAGVIIVTVAALTSLTDGIIVAAFVIVYQQIENHLLQPLVYGRTVELSPLLVLIAVLMGAAVAGILGAIGAIPIASTLQILLNDWREHRPSPVLAGPETGDREGRITHAAPIVPER